MKPKEIVFIPYHGDTSEMGTKKELVFVLEKDPEETMEQAINTALIHLRKVENGEITERNYNPPPMTIERMFAEEQYRHTAHLDHGIVERLSHDNKRLDDAIKDLTDSRAGWLVKLEQNEKGKLREIVKIKRSEINSCIHRIDKKIDHHKKDLAKLVEKLDKAKKYYYKEFSAASQ